MSASTAAATITVQAMIAPRAPSEEKGRPIPIERSARRGHTPSRLRFRRRSNLIRTVSALKTTYRSEEHTSELQSLMRISYAVFCLKTKTLLHSHLLLFHF